MTQPGSWADGFTPEEVVPFNVWSASLPLEWFHIDDEMRTYRPFALVPTAVRPWNGRCLTPQEIDGCRRAFLREYDLTCAVGGAVQAAYEFLSEHCW